MRLEHCVAVGVISFTKADVFKGIKNSAQIKCRSIAPVFDWAESISFCDFEPGADL